MSVARGGVCFIETVSENHADPEDLFERVA